MLLELPADKVDCLLCVLAALNYLDLRRVWFRDRVDHGDIDPRRPAISRRQRVIISCGWRDWIPYFGVCDFFRGDLGRVMEGRGGGTNETGFIPLENHDILPDWLALCNPIQRGVFGRFLLGRHQLACRNHNLGPYYVPRDDVGESLWHLSRFRSFTSVLHDDMLMEFGRLVHCDNEGI